MVAPCASSAAHPGNLLSPALSRALSPFVVAVVSGKDLIPRLSLNSLERLRDDMVTSLARCRWGQGRAGWGQGAGAGGGRGTSGVVQVGPGRRGGGRGWREAREGGTGVRSWQQGSREEQLGACESR